MPGSALPATPGSPESTRAHRGTTAIYFAVVIAELLYVLAFDPFATVDIASHIGSASGFVDFLHTPSATLARLLEWNPLPVPNLLPQLVLVSLVASVGAHLAERLILVGYVLSVSIAMWWAIRQVRPGATVLAFFVLPLTFNLPFLWGFLNFSYSIAGFLVVAGLLIRWNARLDVRRALLLALVLVLVYFTHLVGFLEAGLLAACMLGTAWLRNGRKLEALLLGALALAPATVLMLVFMTATHSAGGEAPFDPLGKLARLLALTAGVVAYDPWERFACLLAALPLWGLVQAALLRARMACFAGPVAGGLTLFLVLSTAVAVLAPESMQSGGTLGYIRYALFPALAAVLWLGHQALPVRALRLAAAAAGTSALLIAGVRIDEFRAMETALRDLRALEPSLPRGATVVQANVRRFKFGEATPAFTQLSAEGGRLAAASGGIDLANVDWSVPFTLLRFRRDTSPYLHLVHPGRVLFAIEATPPPLDLAGYMCRTGIPIDFVLVHGRTMPEGAFESPGWRLRPGSKQVAELALFEQELADLFTRVSVSPRGVWELWGRKDAGAGEPCTQRR